MQTPKFWTKVFEWFCGDDFYEELQGDLEERHALIEQDSGKKAADRYYRREVILMMRPSVLKKLRSTKFSNLSLFKMHWTLSIRNLQRNKVFSAVTIFGFAAAISISLFMINLVYSGYMLDQQHYDIDRIYRVSTLVAKEGETNNFASTPFQLKSQTMADIPGFDYLTHVNRTLQTSFEKNDYPIQVNGIYTDKEFFSIFNFPVILGSIRAIFDDNNSVAITDEVASKIFKGQNPIGQITNDGHVVRAVIKSPKNNSHIPFEIIGNIQTLYAANQSWIYNERNYLYGLISTNTNKAQLQRQLTNLAMVVQRAHEETKTITDFRLQSITGMIFKDEVYNEIGSSFGREGLIIFTVLTALLIAMACFNYTNLSMARALQRTKEIGVRKVVGSRPKQIISQFLIETLLISSIGFLVGLGIYEYYSSRIADSLPFAFLATTNFQIIILFTLFALIVGMAAGLFPAIYFSRISPLALFHKNSSNKKLSLNGLRKLLVGLQVTVSMFCLVLLSLIIDQNRSLRNAATGIKSENLLIVSSSPALVPIQINNLKEIAGVEAITMVSSMPVADFPRETKVIINGVKDSVDTRFIEVDESFENVFEPIINQGEFFGANAQKSGYKEIVVSKGLLSKINEKEETALGTIVKGINTNYIIVGVLEKAISANPLIGQNDAFMLVRAENPLSGRMVLKLSGNDHTNTLNEIETSWSQLYPEQIFQSNFLISMIESTYSEMNRAIRVITFIAGCIILISLLGQLGMALYNAQSRIKEIGIRKVMGASMNRIVRIILKSTTYTILFSALIALPMAYLVFVGIVAPELRNPLQVTPWILLKGALVLTILIVGVVISQTWKVVNLNPSSSLRNE